MSEPELSLVYKLAPALRVDNSDSGGFAGYASTFHFLDYHGDIIAPGAYKADIQRFLTKGFIGGINHDHANPIGKPVELFEDAKGLFLEAMLVDTVKAQEDRKLITSGVVKELSVGIIPLQIKRMTKKETLDYWKKAGYSPSEEELMRSESGTRLIKRAKLLEISPVAMGANEQTAISSYKAGRKISQTTADLLAQVCAQVKASYEMLETLLVDAGIKSESEEEDVAEAPAQAKVAVEDPLNDLLEAFRAYIKE